MPNSTRCLATALSLAAALALLPSAAGADGGLDQKALAKELEAQLGAKKGFRCRYKTKNLLTGNEREAEVGYEAPLRVKAVIPGEMAVAYRDGVCTIKSAEGFLRFETGAWLAKLDQGLADPYARLAAQLVPVAAAEPRTPLPGRVHARLDVDIAGDGEKVLFLLMGGYSLEPGDAGSAFSWLRTLRGQTAYASAADKDLYVFKGERRELAIERATGLLKRLVYRGAAGAEEGRIEALALEVDPAFEPGYFEVKGEAGEQPKTVEAPPQFKAQAVGFSTRDALALCCASAATDATSFATRAKLATDPLAAHYRVIFEATFPLGARRDYLQEFLKINGKRLDEAIAKGSSVDELMREIEQGFKLRFAAASHDISRLGDDVLAGLLEKDYPTVSEADRRSLAALNGTAVVKGFRLGFLEPLLAEARAELAQRIQAHKKG